MYKIYRKNNYLIIDNGTIKSGGYLAKDILIEEIIENISYNIFGISPKFNNTSGQLLHTVSIPNILKEDDSPYTTQEWVDFYTVNTGFFFEVTNGSGDTGSIPANQFVANYSALPDPTTIPYQIWICENAEGTQWLPGSLGGTYYPEGGYVSNGTKWIYHKDNYQATQNEVNIGTVTNKWLSPFTFENASKWNTKENILVSGTNIKTINGDTILGSGDIIIPNLITKITTIDFGINPINEKTFNIVDVNCTTTSKININQYFISQTEENFGVALDLFTECFNGNFNIIAVSKEPFSKGIFNIKYTIL